MKMSSITRLVNGCVFILLSLEASVEGFEPGPVLGKFYNPRPPTEIKINKVSLTQNGYIQFLRYMTEVPVIDEFTFCIWIRSSNLNHSHPLLSYSKHEEQRYVRAWIAPRGRSINLAILEHTIFGVPVEIHENRWYHICQSWNNKNTVWQLYLNGEIRSEGIQTQLLDLQIPAGGDMVVGQEYTDFDKGLDDGIEGDIFGFNFLMESASGENVPTLLFPKYHHSEYEVDEFEQASREGGDSKKESSENELPVLGYFDHHINRQSKEFFDSILRIMFRFFDVDRTKPAITRRIPVYYHHSYKNHPHAFNVSVNPNRRFYSSNRMPTNSNSELAVSKPLGLLLVELSYNNCALGRGSPLVNDKMLISWTKSPVRVFGGAIWKSVTPFCTKK